MIRNPTSRAKTPRRKKPAVLLPGALASWRQIFASLCCGGCVFMQTLSSFAFVIDIDALGHVRRWNLTAPTASTNVFNRATRSIRYYIGADAYSKTNTFAELNAVRAAFDQWQSVPGTGLRFEEAGLAERGIDVNPSDRTNVVFWANGNLRVNGGLDDISNALAVTFPRIASDNVIVEADIVLNGAQVTWFTDFAATNSSDQWIESTVLHEIGHFLGLNHSPVGGATMWNRSPKGINTQGGLSPDEIAAVRGLYPATNRAGGFGDLSGRVLAGSRGIFGAVVIAEDEWGNVVSGTLTDQTGFYGFVSLPVGRYRVRATPLDPATSPSLARLVFGADISAALNDAETNFLSSTNLTSVILNGVTNRLDLRVIEGTPAFRISRIRPATRDTGQFSAINAATAVSLGERDVVVGVYSPDFSLSGAILGITGDGVVASEPSFTANVFTDSKPKLNLISMTISVATNATPGLRSLFVQHGTNIAYANGCLEILPAAPDFNFDGLDDAFQRQHFARFTAIEARPEIDADKDGLSNGQEYVTGSDPTNARSVLKVERVTLSSRGTLVTWQSRPGKRYRVFRRAQSVNDIWGTIGPVITASAGTAELLDPATTNRFAFYRVEVLP